MFSIPKKYENPLYEIKGVLKNPKNKSFFVAGHQNPDGDAVGGCLALYSLLCRLKKDVFLCSCGAVPPNILFIPNSHKIKNIKKTNKKFDIAIILECSELSRLGDIINLKKQSKIDVNIDHHLCSERWANINWADPESSSVSEMIFYLFKFMDMPLTKEEAVALYTGIVTDTHNFTHTNTTPQSHIIASQLLECGIEPSKIQKYVYGTKAVSALHLFGIALNRIQIDVSGKIAWTTITESDLKSTKASTHDTEDIINYVGMIPNVSVWLLFKPSDKKGFIKVSFRSVKEIDVNKIASEFDGGGHRNAAGCTVKGTMEKVIGDVMKRCVA